MRRLVPALAALLGVSLPLLVMNEARADFDLRVIWPTVSLVNPGQSTYPITVSDTGPGTLEARWLGSVVAVSHNGTLDLPLSPDGTGRVEIWRCTPTCAWAGVSSPLLTVRRTLTMSAAPLRIGVAPELQATVTISQLFTPGSLDVSWRIAAGSDGTGATLASGQEVVASSTKPTFTVTPPPDLVAGGDYSWVVTVTAPFGTGTVNGSAAAQPVLVDKTAPQVAATANVDHIEPATDGYLDSVFVDVSASESLKARLEVADADGSLVAQRPEQSIAAGATARLAWDGRLTNGKIAAQGDYQLLLSVTDLFGNQQTTSFPVSVGDGKLAYLTWRSTLKPASNIKARGVATCAALKIPSQSQGAGSVGYVADAKCYHQGTDDNVVWTQYVAKLPPAFKNHYRRLTIDSLASGRSGYKSILRVGPVLTDGSPWDPEYRMIGVGVDWREMALGVARATTQTADGGLMTWRAGTDHQARVDVKRFRITIDHQVLLHPDGTWEIPIG